MCNPRLWKHSLLMTCNGYHGNLSSRKWGQESQVSNSPCIIVFTVVCSLVRNWDHLYTSLLSNPTSRQFPTVVTGEYVYWLVYTVPRQNIQVVNTPGGTWFWHLPTPCIHMGTELWQFISVWQDGMKAFFIYQALVGTSSLMWRRRWHDLLALSARDGTS